MITLTVLTIITISLLIIALLILSIGGTVFLMIFSDLIVVILVIWFLFFRSKTKKCKGPK